MSIRNPDVLSKRAVCAKSDQIGYGRWMRVRGMKLRLLVVAVILSNAPLTVAQQSPPPQSPLPRPNIREGGVPLLVDPKTGQPASPQQMKQQRTALRQKQLMEKTAQLQQFSKELKVEIDKTDKDTLSLDVIRKSEQIEKLAKNIHALMVTPQ